MALTEQPLKKRKLFEPPPEPSVPPPEPPRTLHQSSIAPPLSQEEIIRRRRNREEIRNVYDCYKRIKFCASQKDARLMPDLEQAYLSLITASRGCTSVQRIVADFIPRFASYCPTALEAAAKVIINMHNWSLAVIDRGEDADGVAFETAKACIFGLVDICHTASSEAPTSSVIRGICSAVFFNVLTFFISSFERKDIFDVVDKKISEMEDSLELFSEVKQKFSTEDESALFKLSKFRVLTLLRIIFCCPKSSLAACFELLDSTVIEKVCKDGLYFLRQLISPLDIDDRVHHAVIKDELRPSAETTSEGNKVTSEGLGLDGNDCSGDISPVLRNCLLGMVLIKDPTLRSWFLAKYKKLRKSASSEVLSEVTSLLQGILESLAKEVKEGDSQGDTDEEEPGSSKYIDYVVHRHSNQSEASSHFSGRDTSLRIQERSSNDDHFSKHSGQYLKPHSSVVALEPELRSTRKPVTDSGGSRSMESEPGDLGDISHGRCTTPRELLNNQLLSPLARKSLDLRSTSSEGRSYFGRVEKNQSSSVNLSLPTPRSLSGGVNTACESPIHHSVVAHSSATSQHVWYSDGDPASMDIFPASKQLWVGSLGPDSSEALIRIQFEKFGPIEQFSYSPFKGFAMVEYKNIMDAIKARAVMQGHSHWGACLRIKFLDTGMGTGGVINGVAVGSSCQVYVGNVTNQWARDKTLHESMKVVYKGPLMVTDLTSEGALLMEFETPEDAATVMAHLRRRRKDDSYNEASVSRHGDGTTSAAAGGHVDFRSNNPGFVASPHSQTMLESPADSYGARMSHLSSLLSSMRTKCHIGHNSRYLDNHTYGNYHEASMRMEDRLPTSTLKINIPNINQPYISDDEVMAICDLAIGNAGSVVRLTRKNLQIGLCWFVECNSIDAATTLSNNLRSNPGFFFHIEFSQPGEFHAAHHTMNPESSTLELVPRINPEAPGVTMPSERAFQSNWSAFNSTETPEVGPRKFDGYDNGSHIVSGMTGQMWMYKKQEIEAHPGPGSISYMPTPTQGPPIPPAQSFQPPPFIRPVYFPPNSSWDVRGLNHLPFSPISQGIMPPAPFLPASVTPLAQLQGSSVKQFGQMFPLPVVPPPTSSIQPPLQPDMPPPLPSSPPPPPLPQSMPPLVPPPPSSPPPPPPAPPLEASSFVGSGQGLQYQWQGTLSKSGVHYCTVYAQRVDSNTCNYTNAILEPAGWPAKLDMTKRTDFRHVTSTFSGTPPHKREVCRLLPAFAGDQKGFQDFISYLKQRDCAGVIKIPATKSIWARLLFILPYSNEACSLLSIAPTSPDCLIALVLPKEINFEWA